MTRSTNRLASHPYRRFESLSLRQLFFRTGTLQRHRGCFCSTIADFFSDLAVRRQLPLAPSVLRTADFPNLCTAILRCRINFRRCNKRLLQYSSRFLIRILVGGKTLIQLEALARWCRGRGLPPPITVNAFPFCAIAICKSEDAFDSLIRRYGTAA